MLKAVAVKSEAMRCHREARSAVAIQACPSEVPRLEPFTLRLHPGGASSLLFYRDFRAARFAYLGRYGLIGPVPIRSSPWPDRHCNESWIAITFQINNTEACLINHNPDEE